MAARRSCATCVALVVIAIVLMTIAQPFSAALAAQASDTPRPAFTEWLAGVRAEALSRGIREEIVDVALADVAEPLPIILARDRSQAETVLSLERYIARRLTPKFILSGRDA